VSEEILEEIEEFLQFHYCCGELDHADLRSMAVAVDKRITVARASTWQQAMEAAAQINDEYERRLVEDFNSLSGLPQDTVSARIRALQPPPEISASLAAHDAEVCEPLLAALRSIAVPEGRYSMDRLTHAQNVIEDVAEKAQNALIAYYNSPSPHEGDG
jgi:hypothetical protein